MLQLQQNQPTQINNIWGNRINIKHHDYNEDKLSEGRNGFRRGCQFCTYSKDSSKSSTYDKFQSY